MMCVNVTKNIMDKYTVIPTARSGRGWC